MTSHFCLVALLLISTSASLWASEEEQQLLTKLFENYDSRVRPVKKDNDTLMVEVGLTLRKVIKFKLCSRSRVFEANIWLKQEWVDYRLIWDPQAYDGINQLYVPQSDIFKPDIVLFNSEDPHEEQRQRTKAVVKHNGVIFIPEPIRLNVDCPIYSDSIHAEVNCTLIFGSFVYDAYRIDLKTGFLEVDTFGIMMEFDNDYKYWTIQGMEGRRVEKSFSNEQRYVTIEIDVSLNKNNNTPDELLLLDKSNGKVCLP